MEDKRLKKFEGYSFRIDIPDKENFNPLDEVVEIMLTTRAGEKYSANFAAKEYIPYVFEKNKKTGECVDGTWFGMKDNMIIVREISRRNVKITIDDLIKNLEIESYFEKQ
jgi:hypothetical protein